MTTAAGSYNLLIAAACNCEVHVATCCPHYKYINSDLLPQTSKSWVHALVLCSCMSQTLKQAGQSEAQ